MKMRSAGPSGRFRKLKSGAPASASWLMAKGKYGSWDHAGAARSKMASNNMNRIASLRGAWYQKQWLALLLAAILVTPAAARDIVRVVLETEMGRIEMDIETRRATLTAANFLKYVDGGFYDGGVFHR